MSLKSFSSLWNVKSFRGSLLPLSGRVCCLLKYSYLQRSTHIILGIYTEVELLDCNCAMFKCSRYFKAIFQSVCANLHPDQQHMRVGHSTFSTLVISHLFLAILIGVGWDLSVLIFIDIGCSITFYMLSCHLYIFSGEVFVKVFGYFKIGLFFFLSFKSSLYILDNILYQMWGFFGKYFIWGYNLFSHSLDIVFHRT